MQRYLIAIDPRKIEQVVDEPSHVTQLPIDHCQMLLFERCQGRVAQQSQHISSRWQRCAQFMGKQRNEFIFALLLFHQRLLGTVSVGDIERIAAATPPDLLTFIEIPLDGDIDAGIAAVARAGRHAKVRMGGTTADMVPSPDAVVRFFAACIVHGVTAKATAGLHHPLRGTSRLTYEPDAATGRMYGFLNVALAVAHLASGGSEAEAIALLEEADAGRIEFSDLHVAWHGPDRTLTFTRDALQQMRAHGLVSFGSCSFTEPVDESRALGWL